ncbi:Rossmann-like and DUF2520 domain-containing protein [Ruminococcus flavefaciens]|uniref:Rossmann-like and DUF2520 domain-containing protein n=1 Tax=Ruminococcus flavefaciens TaxID=1265 RepID=UPI0009EC8B94|nr:Rossmann-like and DUF2520 domain-containing protein [Ruminococcus flavefaciens]
MLSFNFRVYYLSEVNDMKIGFIGAGKVGFSLGKYLAEKGMDISGYYSRSEMSAHEAAEFTGSELFLSPERLIINSDAVFITVPDGEIKNTYLSLPKELLCGKQLCHCSGAMSAEEAFPGIAECGAKGTSVHPLFPVSSRTESYKELGNAFFCIEGDCADEWSSIFSSVGNHTRIISSGIKSRYHAACSVASNLVCGLIEESISLLEQCGFNEKEALTALEPLVISNIRRIFAVGPTAALTGPVERNDVSTVKKHLSCISGDIDVNVYRSVTKKLAEMALRRHPEADYTEMNELIR